MHLLFSSFGFRSPLVQEKLQKVLSKEWVKEQTCLVIPYAGFNPQTTFERETEGLVAFGFSRENIVFVKGQHDFQTHFPGVIYVPGGNPFGLLKAVRELHLAHPIKQAVEQGQTLYIGVSAGAYLAAPGMEYVTRLEDNNELEGQDLTALGLIPTGIVCHFDHYSHFHKKECQQTAGHPVLTLKDDQVLVFQNNTWNYVGE